MSAFQCKKMSRFIISSIILILALTLCCDGTFLWLQRGCRCGENEVKRCAKLNPCKTSGEIILCSNNGKTLKVTATRCCLNLDAYWSRSVNKIETNGNCLMAFGAPDCKGPFDVIYKDHGDNPVVNCNVASLKLCS